MISSAVPRQHQYNKVPRKGVTKQMVLEMAKEYNVQFVDFQFTDLHGVLKAVTAPVHKLEELIDNDMWFDGSSIAGFTMITESDMLSSTPLQFPLTMHGEDVTARLICDAFPDGTPTKVAL
jgi:glutamine synthetase